jgi:hypothetical protein
MLSFYGSKSPFQCFYLTIKNKDASRQLSAVMSIKRVKIFAFSPSPHRINNIVSCVSISNGATVHAGDLFALLARSYRLPWLSRYPGRPEVNKIPFQNPHVTGAGEEERDVPTAEVYKSNS